MRHERLPQRGFGHPGAKPGIGWQRIPWLMLATTLPLVLLTLLLAACGGAATPTPPPAPSGSYTSTVYHFALTYPSGWKTSDCLYWDQQTYQCDSSPPVSGPRMGLLAVALAKPDASANANGLVSNLTIAVLDLRNPQSIGRDLLQTIMTRSSNKAYHGVPLAGHTAYTTGPIQQPIYTLTPQPTPGSRQSETHTDYYLLINSFEYHLSTDVLAGDQADDAIKSMLASFSLTA